MFFGFYISGKSSRLSRFIQQCTPAIIKKIAVVVSDYIIEENLKMLLDEHNIKYIEYDWKMFPIGKKSLCFSDKLKENLEHYKVSYCFSFGAHVLKGNLLDSYKYKIINFHPSILPMFPGLKAIDQAIERKNVLLVGNTAHFIDEGIDTGPIIMQSVVPLQKFYLSNGDYDSILDLQIPMLNKLMEIIMEDRLRIHDGHVKIKGADYSQYSIFPKI